MKELHRTIPNSEVYHRRQSSVKKMISKAIEKEYTDVIVVNENSKEPSKSLLQFPVGNLVKKTIERWNEIIIFYVSKSPYFTFAGGSHGEF